jgi:hypothetical protein
VSEYSITLEHIGIVAFARLASFFLLLSQKKETKEKATPYRLVPALHSKVERCGTRPINCWAQTVLAQKLPTFKCGTGAVAGGLNLKPKSNQSLILSSHVILSEAKNPAFKTNH